MRTASPYVLTAGILLWLGWSQPASSQSLDRDLLGSWTWTWKDSEGNPHTHFLEIRGEPGTYVARERLNELEPVDVTNLLVRGDSIRFVVSRGDVRARYTGKYTGENIINGVVRVESQGAEVQEYGWTARKQQPTAEEPSETPLDPGPDPGP